MAPLLTWGHATGARVIPAFSCSPPPIKVTYNPSWFYLHNMFQTQIHVSAFYEQSEVSQRHLQQPSRGSPCFHSRPFLVPKSAPQSKPPAPWSVHTAPARLLGSALLSSRTLLVPPRLLGVRPLFFRSTSSFIHLFFDSGAVANVCPLCLGCSSPRPPETIRFHPVLSPIVTSSLSGERCLPTPHSVK